MFHNKGINIRKAITCEKTIESMREKKIGHIFKIQNKRVLQKQSLTGITILFFKKRVLV